MAKIPTFRDLIDKQSKLHLCVIKNGKLTWKKVDYSIAFDEEMGYYSLIAHTDNGNFRATYMEDCELDDSSRAIIPLTFNFNGTYIGFSKKAIADQIAIAIDALKKVFQTTISQMSKALGMHEDD